MDEKDFDYVAWLKEARKVVEDSPLYPRFIKHTPLENDIAVWMTDFALRVMFAAKLEKMSDGKT